MKPDRPSSTARMIAAATIVAAREGIEPAPGEEAVEWCRRFLGADAPGRRFLRSIESRAGRSLWRAVERLVAPGIVRHMARRKAWIERACRAAIDEGFTQLLVIGAGFDTLGARTARSDTRIRVVEVDHPATQRVKARALGEATPPPVHLIPADLARVRLADALRIGADDAALDPAADTVVIAEGLLMYLTPTDAEALLRDIASLPPRRLRLIMTFMERTGPGPAGFRPRGPLVTLWLHLRSEPFRWGPTRDEARTLLGARGFSVRDMVDERDLAELWPGEVLEGEVLTEAEKAR